MRKLLKVLLIPLSLTILLMLAISTARADLVDDLKAKIDERNKVIRDLEKEITEYQAQVEKTSAQGKTLKNSITALELTRKKLSVEITAIENKIASATLSIRKLDIQISDAESKIAKEIDILASMLRQTNEEESNSLIETILNYQNISNFLDKIESLAEFNQALKTELANVRLFKQNLEQNKSEAQGKRQELITLAGSLTDKKKVAEYNKAQTNKLLTQTKNQEANYRKLLQEKQTLRDAFERELLDYESQLKFTIDPTSLPKTGTGVLQWPLGSVKITQYFGNTEFAKSGAYKGQGHNGIDLKAAIGTAVKSALSGQVVASGNTDTVCLNASYGKWVLIEHLNGLSTLYAHLSVIKVTSGQSVNTGEIIGYSGETGYATGPHLHFTVYATQGVKITSRKSTVCKGTYTIPVASLNAYLNPLLYL